MKETVFTIKRPEEFTDFQTRDDENREAANFYRARTAVIEPVKNAFVTRLEAALKEQTKYTETKLPSRTVVEKRLYFPTEDYEISLELHVGTVQKTISQKDILANLETRLLDTVEESREGWQLPYVKKIRGQYYILLDFLPQSVNRWTSRKSGQSLRKSIRLNPPNLHAQMEGTSKKRILLPGDITTEEMKSVALTFLDHATYTQALSDGDKQKETQQLMLKEYLRGREFSESVNFKTCVRFEDALRRKSSVLKDPWIEIGDLLFHVPRIRKTTAQYKKIIGMLFSDDIGSPGDFYLMLHADEFDEASKKMKDYGIKVRDGQLYIPIDAVLDKISYLRANPKIISDTSKWDPITSSPLQ
jgi:hypothetical protein